MGNMVLNLMLKPLPAYPHLKVQVTERATENGCQKEGFTNKTDSLTENKCILKRMGLTLDSSCRSRNFTKSIK